MAYISIDVGGSVDYIPVGATGVPITYTDNFNLANVSGILTTIMVIKGGYDQLDAYIGTLTRSGSTDFTPYDYEYLGTISGSYGTITFTGKNCSVIAGQYLGTFMSRGIEIAYVPGYDPSVKMYQLLTTNVFTAGGTRTFKYPNDDPVSGGVCVCIYATGDATVPDQPSNVSATDNLYDKVTITWTPGTGESNGNQVYRNGSAIGSTVPHGTNSYNDICTPGTYSYTVKSINSMGYSASSAANNGTRLDVPIAPTNVSATDNLYDKVTITWTPGTGETDGHRVYRNGIDISGAVTHGTNTYYDTTSVAGTTYSYTVKAINPAGLSLASTADNGTRLGVPNAPTNVSATNNLPAEIYIVWIAGVGETDGHRVYRNGTDVSGIIPHGNDYYSDTNVVAGTTYSYTVKAINPAGLSLASAAVNGNALDVPDAPTNVYATNDLPTKVLIIWNAGVGETTGHTVYRNGIDISGIVPHETNYYDDTTAVVGTTYSYTVKAINEAGLSVASSAVNGVRLTVPSAPTNVSATDNLYDRVTITWTPGTGETNGHRVYRNGTDISGIVAHGTNTYNDTTAVVGTTYSYTVKAINAAGLSVDSVADNGVRLVFYLKVSQIFAQSENEYDALQKVSQIFAQSENEYDALQKVSQIFAQIEYEETQVGFIVYTDVDGLRPTLIPDINTRYKVHIFPVSGNFEITEDKEVDYLIVAGGGAGGVHGGGGAGGLLTGTTTISSGTYPIVVGAGGIHQGGTSGSPVGGNGENSEFNSIIAYGGGAGGNVDNAVYTNGTGLDGGSGGGGGANSSRNAGHPGGSGRIGQGYAGSASPGENYSPCGGGGGASEPGHNYIPGSAIACDGGDGIQSSLSGTPTYYAGGGGGGVYSTARGFGGLGGGGNGGIQTQNIVPTPGTENTGGGGGGGYASTPLTIGTSGGSGIVIIRYEYNVFPIVRTYESTDISVSSFTANGEVFNPDISITTVYIDGSHWTGAIRTVGIGKEFSTISASVLDAIAHAEDSVHIVYDDHTMNASITNGFNTIYNQYIVGYGTRKIIDGYNAGPVFSYGDGKVYLENIHLINHYASNWLYLWNANAELHTNRCIIDGWTISCITTNQYTPVTLKLHSTKMTNTAATSVLSGFNLSNVYFDKLSYVGTYHEDSTGIKAQDDKAVDGTIGYGENSGIEGYLIDVMIGHPITERGFIYKTGHEQIPTFEDYDGSFTEIAGEGILSYTFDGLTDDTTYSVRAYAINDIGLTLGNIIETTTKIALKVITYEATDTTFASFTANGEVLSLGTGNHCILPNPPINITGLLLSNPSHGGTYILNFVIIPEVTLEKTPQSLLGYENPVTLTWNAVDATYVTLDNGEGTIETLPTLSGSIEKYQEHKTVYTVTAYNGENTVSTSISISCFVDNYGDPTLPTYDGNDRIITNNPVIDSGSYYVNSPIISTLQGLILPENTPFTITISHPSTSYGVQIYYTLDGSVPTNLSNLYSGPVSVQLTDFLGSPPLLTVRAIAFDPITEDLSVESSATAQLFISCIANINPPEVWITDENITTGETEIVSGSYNEIVIVHPEVYEDTTSNGIKTGETEIVSGSYNEIVIVHPEVYEDTTSNGIKTGETEIVGGEYKQEVINP